MTRWGACSSAKGRSCISGTCDSFGKADSFTKQLTRAALRLRVTHLKTQLHTLIPRYDSLPCARYYAFISSSCMPSGCAPLHMRSSPPETAMASTTADHRTATHLLELFNRPVPESTAGRCQDDAAQAL
eukprot:scaffold14290_cov17-Tisochrysis_lutea.AAC.3